MDNSSSPLLTKKMHMLARMEDFTSDLLLPIRLYWRMIIFSISQLRESALPT